MINKKQTISIKNTLLKFNLKQVDLAKKLSVSKQQLNNVINGKVENLKLEERIFDYIKSIKYNQKNI